MKKIVPLKLHLNRETLRQLNGERLTGVGGGTRGLTGSAVCEIVTVFFPCGDQHQPLQA